MPGLVLRESITGRSYQNQRRAKLNAVPKAIFTSYLAFLLAIYLIGLPLHGVLQKYLPFVYLLGWTEYVQLLSLPLIALAFLRNEFSFTRKVAAVPIFCAAGALTTMELGSLKAGLSGYLLVFGTLGLGFSFPTFVSQYLINPKRIWYVALLFGFGVFGATWILLEAPLGLSNFFHYGAERYGASRAIFSFDGPMMAGQYYWLLGALSLFVVHSFHPNRTIRKVSLFTGILFLFSTIATLSRGPIALSVFTASIFIFVRNFHSIEKSTLQILGALILICGVTVVGYFTVLDEDMKFASYSLFDSFLSSNEQSNSLRIERIKEGWYFAKNDFKLEGHGSGLLSHFNESGRVSDLNATDKVQFENTYLTISYGLGIWGATLSIWILLFYLLQLLKLSTSLMTLQDYPLGLLSFVIIFPWLFYSNLFPAFSQDLSSLVLYAGWSCSAFHFHWLPQETPLADRKFKLRSSWVR